MPESICTVLLAADVDGTRAFQWSNVSAANGIAIAITGMLIVFFALTLIAFAIAALPRILESLDPYLPTVEHHGQAPPPAKSLPGDEEKIVAAIGMVLHAEAHEARRT